MTGSMEGRTPSAGADKKELGWGIRIRGGQVWKSAGGGAEDGTTKGDMRERVIHRVYTS